MFMKEIKTNKKSFWLKLDNAAKIFPGQNSNTWSSSFRICYEMKEKVDPELLQKALIDIMPRFSCYDVRIRYGFFWFYLEKNNNTPAVRPDIKNPLYRVKFNENRKFLFKVFYHGNRISVDMYHVLSDGHGGAILLSTLVAQYLRLKGYDIPNGGFVFDINEKNSSAELEDSFVKNATSKAKYKRADKFCYHAKGTRMPWHTANYTTGIIPFDDLHALAKGKGVTVTEFLCAVMLDVLIKKQAREERKQKEVCIQVPIDLRKTFGSETLRNFSICLRVKIDPNKGEYSFDELLEQAKYQLRLQRNEKELNMMITANMGIERNMLVRALPLVLKNLGVGVSFAITAEQTNSCLLTNLGPITIPEEMRKYTEKFILIPPPGKVNAARIGVATLNNNLCITFANSYVESDVEREFFTRFVKMGLHVKIESNRE